MSEFGLHVRLFHGLIPPPPSPKSVFKHFSPIDSSEFWALGLLSRCCCSLLTSYSHPYTSAPLLPPTQSAISPSCFPPNLQTCALNSFSPSSASLFSPSSLRSLSRTSVFTSRISCFPPWVQSEFRPQSTNTHTLISLLTCLIPTFLCWASSPILDIECLMPPISIQVPWWISCSSIWSFGGCLSPAGSPDLGLAPPLPSSL